MLLLLQDQGMSVKIVAYDLGIPPLSSTLTLSVLIQVSVIQFHSVSFSFIQFTFKTVKICQTPLQKVHKM